MTTIRSERIVDAPGQCPRCRSLDVIHFINEKLGELGAKRGVVVGRRYKTIKHFDIGDDFE